MDSLIYYLKLWKNNLKLIRRQLPPYNPNIRDIWALGIAVVIGGQYAGWNSGFSAGFASFSIIYLLHGCAFIVLICSIAETASTLPYAGGAWGQARFTIGFYPGYLIGCCEILEYTSWGSLNANNLVEVVSTVTYIKCICFLVFALANINVLCIGGRLFWPLILSLAVVSLIILLIYSFGALRAVDFNNARSSQPQSILSLF